MQTAVAAIPWVLLVATADANLIGLLSPVPGIDEGVFLVIGRRMHQGELPYRDFFDHKTPGIYAVTWFLTFFTSNLGVLRVLFFALCGLCWMPLALAARRAGQAARRVGVIAVAVALHPFVDGGFVLTEQAEAALVVLALGLVWLAARSASGNRVLVVSGLAGGVLAVAVLFRPTALLFLAPAVWFLLLTGRRHGDTGGRAVLSLTGTFLAVVAGVLATLAAAGLLGDFYRQAIVANVSISWSSAGGRPHVLADFLRNHPWLVVLALQGLAGLGRKNRGLAVGLGLSVAAAAIDALLPNKPFAHYAIPLAVSLVPGVLCSPLMRSRRVAWRESGISLAVGALLLLPTAEAISTARSSLAGVVAPAPVRIEGIDLDFIRKHNPRGDPVWAGGTIGAALYWYTGWPCATRYLYTEAGARLSGISSDAMLSQLRTSRPRLVLVGPAWRGNGECGLNRTSLPGFCAFLESQYEEVAVPESARSPHAGLLYVRRAQ